MIIPVLETLKPSPASFLDGVPPDKRVVIIDVTWDDYESLYPDPDLAAEVDISPPRIDRPGIYAALKVPKFWRVRNNPVSIEQLGPDATYVPVPRSRFLPVRGEEDVAPWVFSEDSSSLVAWKERLRQWVRDALVPQTDA